MKFLIAIGLVAAMTEGKVQPPQSATPITSSDPFTREMEDKLGRILEIQNEKEMTNGPAKTVDRHENAMLVEMVKQLEKLTRAVGRRAFQQTGKTRSR